MPAEALLDSLIQATAVPENFGGAPGDFRAAQLPDANSENAFLRLFGKSQRMEACECERDNNSNMLQALRFINGKSILARVNESQRPGGEIGPAKIVGQGVGDGIVLMVAGPTSRRRELEVCVQFLTTHAARRGEAVQDLFGLC